MAIHKNYHKGDVYQHTAARENDISMMLNQMPGLRIGSMPSSHSGLVRVACYNSTSKKIVAGSAVMFSTGKPFCGNAVPIEIHSDNEKPFAVLENTLESDKIGNAIVAGSATVTVTGNALDYVIPDPSTPGSFKYSDNGTARVLLATPEKTLVLLGAPGQATSHGSFVVKLENAMLTVSAGYLNRNGEFLSIPAKSGLTPAPGILCLCSTIKDGSWTVPDLRIAEPAADAYPIAEISVVENNISIRQFPVAVAVILLTKHCPLTKE